MAVSSQLKFWQHSLKWSEAKLASLDLILAKLFLKSSMIFWYWIVYIGEVCKRNCQRQRHEAVLASATLGDATQIGSFIFMSLRPRWTRQESSDCRCRQHYRANFRHWKHGLKPSTVFFFFHWRNEMETKFYFHIWKSILQILGIILLFFRIHLIHSSRKF
jgi:hypothetical protein